MQIGAVGMGFPTYIYNTNRVSSKSLDKISAISDDALESKVGYGDSSENTNSLRIGQSKSFADIIQSQMSMSRLNASRLMKKNSSDEEKQNEEQITSDMEMFTV